MPKETLIPAYHSNSSRRGGRVPCHPPPPHHSYSVHTQQQHPAAVASLPQRPMHHPPPTHRHHHQHTDSQSQLPYVQQRHQSIYQPPPPSSAAAKAAAAAKALHRRALDRAQEKQSHSRNPHEQQLHQSNDKIYTAERNHDWERDYDENRNSHNHKNQGNNNDDNRRNFSQETPGRSNSASVFRRSPDEEDHVLNSNNPKAMDEHNEGSIHKRMIEEKNISFRTHYNRYPTEEQKVYDRNGRQKDHRFGDHERDGYFHSGHSQSEHVTYTEKRNAPSNMEASGVYHPPHAPHSHSTAPIYPYPGPGYPVVLQENGDYHPHQSNGIHTIPPHGHISSSTHHPVTNHSIKNSSHEGRKVANVPGMGSKPAVIHRPRDGYPSHPTDHNHLYTNPYYPGAPYCDVDYASSVSAPDVAGYPPPPPLEPYYPGYYPPTHAYFADGGDKERKHHMNSSSMFASNTLASSDSMKRQTEYSEEQEEMTTAFPSQPPALAPRTTKRIIGSHTPIHVPRADDFQMSRKKNDDPSGAVKNSGPNPFKRAPARGANKGHGKGFGSVFRCSSDEKVIKNSVANDADERTARDILMSLSKSFDNGDSITKNRRNKEMNEDARDDGVEETRPNSPDGPPRIQHFHKHQSGDSFEPQPSPLRPALNNEVDGSNIEFAPSFTLFNQSFDMNLEGLLGPNASFGFGPMKSLSFGLGVGGSIDYLDNPRSSPVSIHRHGGSYLGNSSKYEVKSMDSDLEYSKSLSNQLPAEHKLENVQVLCASPSSSFENVMQESTIHGQKNTTNVMVLEDSVRVTSPSAIDTHRSSHVLHQDNYKGESISQNNVVLDGSARKLPFRLKGEDNQKDTSTDSRTKKNNQRSKSQTMDSNILKVMEKHESVFGVFSFLLPGAKSLIEARTKSSTVFAKSKEAEIARRRVNSALCAFGGVPFPPVCEDTSIVPKKSVSRQRYEDSLPERYYEDENRLSWEIEEHPPIEISDEEEEGVPLLDTEMKYSAYSPTRSRGLLSCDSSDSKGQSYYLLRNIGIMVYPAVNAFTANEPGIITQALSEMNNFVDSNEPESTPAKEQIKSLHSCGKVIHPAPLVTPDSVRLVSDVSQQSTLSSDDITPKRKPCILEEKNNVNYAGGAWISDHLSPRRKMGQVKPVDAASTDLLFIDPQDLLPEQYRTVTQKRRKISHSCYDYPALPLPYVQRKRISNAMFALSKNIPGLTDECALVLGEARKQDAWDFAVAQLMTQVIVLTHCSAEDRKLDGLSKYLLMLGIAC